MPLKVAACRQWLEAEIEVVGPELIVCLGAIAAKGLLGASFRVTKERGRIHSMILGGRQVQVSATVHPSSILRAPDEEAREREFEAFVADLSAVAHQLV